MNSEIESILKKMRAQTEIRDTNKILGIQRRQNENRRNDMKKQHWLGTPTWNKPLPENKVEKRRKPVIKIANPFKNLNKQLETRLIGWLGLEELEGTAGLEEEDATSNHNPK